MHIAIDGGDSGKQILISPEEIKTIYNHLLAIAIELEENELKTNNPSVPDILINKSPGNTVDIARI